MARREDATRIAIVGGGVAALEAMLAIREIGGPLSDVNVFAPRSDFVLKPMGVSEAFGLSDSITYDIETLAANAGATFHRRGVAGIDRANRQVLAHDDERYPYDYLVVATGTKALWVVPGAKTFWGLQGQEVVSELLASPPGSGRIVVTLPEPAVWPLPAYELALFLADRSREDGLAREIVVVTPEDSPLSAFGPEASAQIVSILDSGSVGLITGTAPNRFAEGKLETTNGPVDADQVITLPRLTGRQVDGLPFDRTGFLQVDDVGLIDGCSREYAAGDVTSYPIKFGGAATEQADAVAAAIGAAAWGAPDPAPYFEADLHATLLTPGGPIELGRKARPSSDFEEDTDWNPARKLSGRFLTPVLTAESAERDHE